MGGRQPLCGMGVTSRIAEISSPAFCKARIADSRPTPGPFVLYGVLRYLFLVHTRNMGGSPEEIFMKDRPLLLNFVLWLAASAAILLVAA